MHRQSWLQATVQRARHRARRALERARQQSGDAAASTSTINTTEQANVVVTMNVGEERVARAASARQAVAIRQPDPEPDKKGER
jgi:hypothetical protein